MRLPLTSPAVLAAAVLLLGACTAELSTAPTVAGYATPTFAVTDVAGTGAAVALQSYLDKNKCIDVAGLSTDPGTEVQLWDCHNGVNQTFTWTTANELRYSGVCATAEGTGGPGSWIVMMPCTGAATQRWVATSAGALTGPNGLCLDIPYAATTNGQRLIVWHCTGSANQLWKERVVTAAPALPPDLAPAPAAGAWAQAPTTPVTWAYRAYTVPSGAIALAPGDNWQTKVNAAPVGAAFVVRAGTHRRVQVSPKNGQVFVGEPGAVLDGEGVTLAAFDTRFRPSSGVAVRGLTIQHYATTDIVGAVQGDNATNWTVEGNEIHANAGTGMRAGPGMQVRDNYLHHNGFAGLSGWRANGAVVERNEVSYNNASGSTPDHPTGGAAGVKFVTSDNLRFRYNYAHHNTGIGMWCDEGCYAPTYEYNTVSDNYYRGIFVELTYDAVIRYNTTERNQTTYSDGWPAGGGIVVSAAPNVEVYGNVVRDNGDGIFGFQAEHRGAGARGEYVLANFYVHDNLVRQPTGRTGVGQLVGDPTYWTSRNNRFANNTYQLTGNARPFLWTGNGANTEAEWQAIGQDATGTFTR